MRVLALVTFFCINLSIWMSAPLCAEQIQSSTLDRIEKQLELEISKQKVSENKKAQLYILGARELLALKEYARAQKIYKKVLGLSNSDAISEAYNNLLLISYRTDKADLKKLFLDAKKFWSIKKDFVSKGLLSFWAEATHGNYKTLKNYAGPNKLFLTHENVEKLIKAKKYEEALFILSQGDNSQGPTVHKVLVDLLRTVVFKKVETLNCVDKLDKYPNSTAFTLQICRSLVEYKNGKKITSEKITAIAKQIQIETPKRKYWGEMLKELL